MPRNKKINYQKDFQEKKNGLFRVKTTLLRLLSILEEIKDEVPEYSMWNEIFSVEKTKDRIKFIDEKQYYKTVYWLKFGKLYNDMLSKIYLEVDAFLWFIKVDEFKKNLIDEYYNECHLKPCALALVNNPLYAMFSDADEFSESKRLIIQRKSELVKIHELLYGEMKKKKLIKDDIEVEKVVNTNVKVIDPLQANSIPDINTLKKFFIKVDKESYGHPLTELFLHTRNEGTYNIDELLMISENLFFAMEDFGIEPYMDDSIGEDVEFDESMLTKDYRIDFDYSQTDISNKEVYIKYNGWTYKGKLIAQPVLSIRR